MFFSFYFIFGFISGVYVAQEYNVPNVRETFEKIKEFVNETNLNNKVKNDTIVVKEEDTETGSELELELSEEEEPDETSGKKTR